MAAVSGIFSVSRVRVEYATEGDKRRLTGIKRLAGKAEGTVTGEVVESHGWWVEVKPKDGPADGFAVHFPFDRHKDVGDVVKDLRKGDVVAIRYTTDSERHRIEAIRKKPAPEKAKKK